MALTASKVPLSYITYSKKTYTDASSSGTPITASSMNNIENGLNNLYNRVNDIMDMVQPKVLFKRAAENPDKAPVTVTINYDVNNFNRLKIFGVTNEYKRCSVDLIRDNNSTSSFSGMYFTLACYNGSGSYGYLKMTDYKIVTDSGKTSFIPQYYNEFAGQDGFLCNSGIGPTIYAVYAYMI